MGRRGKFSATAHLCFFKRCLNSRRPQRVPWPGQGVSGARSAGHSTCRPSCHCQRRATSRLGSGGMSGQAARVAQGDRRLINHQLVRKSACDRRRTRPCRLPPAIHSRRILAPTGPAAPIHLAGLLLAASHTVTPGHAAARWRGGPDEPPNCARHPLIHRAPARQPLTPSATTRSGWRSDGKSLPSAAGCRPSPMPAPVNAAQLRARRRCTSAALCRAGDPIGCGRRWRALVP